MVGVPLMELEESLVFGMFPTRLLIFEDRIEVRGFELLREKIESKGYDRVDRVVVSGEGWLANLVISEKGRQPILIRGVDKGDAERAGTMIEERVTRANRGSTQATPPTTIDEEGLIQNLTELRDAGILSEEFEAKRGGCCGNEERTRRIAADSVAPPSARETEPCSIAPSGRAQNCGRKGAGNLRRRVYFR